MKWQLDIPHSLQISPFKFTRRLCLARWVKALGVSTNTVVFIEPGFWWRRCRIHWPLDKEQFEKDQGEVCNVRFISTDIVN